MMKKSFILIVLSLIFWNNSYAQKIGYIDSKYILSKVPEYAKAKQEVNQLAASWEKEIDALNVEADKLRKSYQAEEVLLTDEMKKERQAQIALKEKAAREQQKKIFGFEGLFFLKQQELIKPVQDKVFEAVEKVSKKRKVHFMFDKGGDYALIYTNPAHDYTDYVLEELGLGDKNDVIDNKKKK